MKHPEMLPNDDSFYVVTLSNVTFFERRLNSSHYSNTSCTSALAQAVQPMV